MESGAVGHPSWRTWKSDIDRAVLLSEAIFSPYECRVVRLPNTYNSLRLLSYRAMICYVSHHFQSILFIHCGL